MKDLKNDAFKNNVWQQVAVKIKNADTDRRNEDQDLMNKVRSIIENKKTTRSLVHK